MPRLPILNPRRAGVIPLIARTLLLAVLASASLAQDRVSVSSASTETATPLLLLVDGKLIEAEVATAARGTQALIWLRDLEKLGWGRVEPSSADQIVFKTKSVTLTFLKNQSVAMLNSLAVRLPVDTAMRDGKFMVPLSFVAKSLGYEYQFAEKPVAMISTTPAKRENSIRGRVTHNGVGVKGVRVRVVDPAYNEIKDASGLTDDLGSFTVGGLADGDYMAYVFVKDNPDYFNRTSDQVKLKGGVGGSVGDIPLIRMISPVSPKRDAVVTPKDGAIKLEWSPVPGATAYSVTVTGKDARAGKWELGASKNSEMLKDAKMQPGLYEVRVKAVNASSVVIGATPGAGASPWTFTVRTPAKKQ